MNLKKLNNVLLNYNNFLIFSIKINFTKLN